ncbi:dUTP diphosphatase [Ureibacillus thermosphaericus]|uniref:Dimeric dUTPase (All-alpha-NTP-PPase superfamily) n=1 Tax=Ureibacillus thermosphaericus TaxID=51173 RepID=A0A840PZC2_URETH|nr:dUTP diphosphatase [Ureibacillus thermosphaericus]MBB5148196.1 dimeric dUTPase (all-alpha-NTP-PPase superfamily) [Ureibacillus thermosphaericus]NKZ31106.1 dUTPase [Ureibacillus thermosphaericus]
MDLQKLFEIQAELDYHITKEHPVKEGEDRLTKKILALQVELGELANEWRGFKFWSKDQKPRRAVYEICKYCEGRKTLGFQFESCWYCGGTGLQVVKRPLLEEYVDCLHFILSIGNDITYLTDDEIEEVLTNAKVPDDYGNIVDTFIVLNSYSCELKHCEKRDYINLLTIFLNLGYELGFTDEQIEQAYLKKNEENHRRQLTNY